MNLLGMYIKEKEENRIDRQHQMKCLLKFKSSLSPFNPHRICAVPLETTFSRYKQIYELKEN